MRPCRLLVAAVLGVLVVTCKKDSSGPQVATTVQLNATTVTLVSVGATQALTATVKDQNGATMGGATVAWSTDNGGVATVVGGLVTAVSNGGTQVHATSGAAVGTANVNVAQAAAAIVKVAGDAQTDTVGQQLTTGLTVQVNDALAHPIAGVTVNFVVTQGGGGLSAPSAVTAANGQVAVNWTIGTTAGAVQRVTVSAATGSATPVTFSATAVAGTATNMIVQSGDGQSALVGTAVALSPTVKVRDQFGNGVAGIELTFAVTGGGGNITATMDTTGASGLADAGTWTLGGAGSNTLSATVTAGAVGIAAVSFSATGQNATIVVNAGNNQTGLVGFGVNVQPSVLVRDLSSVPIAGAPVDFVATFGGGSVSGGSTTTNAQGIATVGSWILGAAPGPDTLTATVGGVSVKISATGQAEAYFIDVRYLTSVTAPQHAAFDSAVARWQRLIYGDVTDIPISGVAAGTCGPGTPAINETVDDILIFVQLDSIDGPGKILGQASPCLIRSVGKLPVVGVMHFDTADVAGLLATGQLDEVVLHEMGHVLGYAPLWSTLGLLVGPVSAGGTDPHFVGAQATAAFDRSGGAGYSAGAKIPVENTCPATVTPPCPGTTDGHWRESVFDTELMTGILDAGVANPLSVITTASMQDLGYLVNYAASDPYIVANPLAAAAMVAGTGSIDLRDDMLRIPIYVVDQKGRVVGVIAPR